MIATQPGSKRARLALAAALVALLAVAALAELLPLVPTAVPPPSDRKGASWLRAPVRVEALASPTTSAVAAQLV